MVKFDSKVKKAFEEKYGMDLNEYLWTLSFEEVEKLEFIATASNDSGYARGLNAALNLNESKAYDNGYKDGLLDVINEIHNLMRERE